MQQPKIIVAIRKRPLSKKETSRGETDIVTVKNDDTVIVSEMKQKVDLTKFMEETIFNFDYAFHENTNNEQIYDMAVRPLVDSAFQGAKVTCFAYGQTGSGKTFTMNGVMNQGIPGLYTLGANDIFDYLASPHFRHLKARLSFYQIYCGKLYDLLNKRSELKLRQDNKNNINIIGLEQAPVSSSEDFIDYLEKGSKERVTSQNSANADSSRSHAILQISLKDGKKLFGKISFIDLAGNERGADHMDMDKQTRIDGAEINKSLLSLKECIRALDQGKGHTPFRGSKLTMVLKDSFVGFCRTVMIGNVSPSSASSENTLNTLRYADRVKQLRKPQEAGSREDQKAREMMLPRQNKNAIRIMINNDDDAEDIAGKREEARKEYGLPEEQKKIKEDLSVRKNSFGPNKSSNKTEVKSSSVAKNHLAGSLASKPNNIPHNNLVGPPPMLGKLNNNNNRVQPPSQDRVPEGLQRYNSSNYGTLRKEEPMEIESTSSPYYMPNKPLGNQRAQAPRPQQMNQSQTLSNSQTITNNYSNLSMSSNPSQNNIYIQQPRGYTNYHSSYNNQGDYNYQQGMSNYPPNNYAHQSNYNNNNNFQQGGQGNYRQPTSNNNNNRYRPQVIQYQAPQNWQDMVNSVAISNDPSYTQFIVTHMNEQLFTEEQDLVRNHSDGLRKEIDIIKTEMNHLNQMEIERGKITSRDYVRFMQESIEDKISLLEELREKMISFTYKLDAMEEVQRMGQGGRNNDDDQLLLDDIN